MTIKILVQQVQRVIIEHTAEEKYRVGRYADEHDLHLVRNGPKLDENPRAVPGVFQYIGEKVVSNTEG